MKVIIVVKAETPDSAVAIAKHKLSILRHDEPPKVKAFDKMMKHCIIEVEATLAQITQLNSWFVDVDPLHDGPPYKIGTLLHWGSSDTFAE